MTEKITIKELYEELFQKLESMPGLTEFYIGKTDNICSRQQQHQKNYEYTQEIAYGDPQIIKKAESYLIKKFLKSKLPCNNKTEQSLGNPKADKLYVSYNYDKSKIKSDGALDDDDLNIYSRELTYSLNNHDND